MVSVGATFALIRGSSYETNVVTIGNVDVELHEDYPNDGQTLVPGAKDVKKEVWVENTGNLPCYVRILVKREWRNASGTTVNPLPSDLLLEMISPNYINTNDWVKGTTDTGDGYEYYYYQHELPVGEVTSHLMDTFDFVQEVDGVEFSTEKYGGYKGIIEVKAQAVQSEYVTDKLVKSGGKIVHWDDTVFS